MAGEGVGGQLSHKVC